MRFRFLYLNEAGEEVEVGGLEELRACVAMGRVDENTLLFDAVTREWAPARAHSAYRLLADEIDGPAAGIRAVGSGRAPEAKPSTSDDPDEDVEAEKSDPDDDILGELSSRRGEQLPKLTPLAEPELPDPVSLFLEKQERERRLESEEPTASTTRHESFNLIEPSEALVDHFTDPVDEPAPEQQPDRSDDHEPEVREAARVEPSSSDREIVPPQIKASRPPTPIQRRPVGRRRRQVGMVVAAAIVVAGLWTVFGDDGAQAGDLPAVASDDGAPPPPAPVGALADAVSAAQGSAFDEMVQVMDSLRSTYELEGGPGGWLDGHYLATASEYPHVRAYWQRYRQYTSELRTRDTVLFRTSFVQRLRDDGLEGPVLSMRLASAMDDFRESQPAREALYQGMDSLSERALALHELLLLREGDVEYDPVQLGTVSRDPVMEAFPNDEELQREIWAHLDGIFEAMDVVQGGVPGSRDQLTDAALSAIRRSPGRR